jgi:hypothetical protein
LPGGGNLLGIQAAGSGIYLQGPYAGQYQSENIIENCRMEYANRFGFEIGENVPDGMTSKLVTGTNCPLGGAIFRSADWTIDDYHPTGCYGTFQQVGPALTICAGEFRADKIFPDTYPGTLSMAKLRYPLVAR